MNLQGNWGWGMVVLYGIFALFIIGFLIFANTQRVDLVAPNYYEQEIRYQEQIDRIQRTKALPEGLVVQVTDRRARIRFPSSMKGERISGQVRLYRPSNSLFDVQVPIIPDAHMLQEVVLDKLVPGLWRMKIEWQAGGVSYYNEEEFSL